MRRPRGTGRIYRQKDSSIWWIKFYRNGEPFRESTGTPDKRKATRALNQRLAEVTTGKFVGPYVERVPITELAADVLRDYRINGKTSIDDAEARWRLHLEPCFGSLRATQVTSSLINSYDYVFTRPNGKRVKDFRGTWDNARIAAGCPNLLFHDLRRTAARNHRRIGTPQSTRRSPRQIPSDSFRSRVARRCRRCRAPSRSTSPTSPCRLPSSVPVR